MSYIQIQSMFESFFPPGRHVYTRSNLLRDLSDEAIETTVEYVAKTLSPYTFAPFVEHWNGKSPPRSSHRYCLPSPEIFVELSGMVHVGRPVGNREERAIDLSDHLKTGQRRSGQNRPTREAGTELFYSAESFGGKLVFVRQLRGPHLSTCP
jgi:hypothetical protein